MNWWGSESRLIVHFCVFSGPLVYGKDTTNSAQTVFATVCLLVCSLETLFSRNPFINFLDTAQEVQAPQWLERDRAQIFEKINILGKYLKISKMVPKGVF